MARGTTRQILADLQAHHQSHSPVQITRSPDAKMVQITVAHGDDVIVAARKCVRVFAGIFAALVLLFALFRVPLFVVVCGWLLIASVITMLLSYDRAARAYVFRVGRDKVVVTSSGPFGARYWEFDSDKVRDVRLKQGRSCYILFDLAGGYANRKGFVLDLPREEFVQLVDAVREGLGMPKMEWK